VLNANATNPERIPGVWENGIAHSSDITVSARLHQPRRGNNPAATCSAFHVTSHSSASTVVAYTMLTVNGANIGFGKRPRPLRRQLAGRLSGNAASSTTGFLQSNGGLVHRNNSVTGTGSSVGRTSARSARLGVGRSFNNSSVGIDVDGTLRNGAGATALIEGANLNNNSIAGLRLQNGAQVDAGGGGTALGTSAGGNDFSAYVPSGPGRAIQNLNTEGATGTFVSAPPDMRAQTTSSPARPPSSSVVNHDVSSPRVRRFRRQGPRESHNYKRYGKRNHAGTTTRCLRDLRVRP
jgi:hypothetical protein